MWYQHVRTFLTYLGQIYPTAGGILIAEFGFPTFEAAEMLIGPQRDNLPQSIYYMAFLREMLKAIHEDGVRMAGVIGWAFIDNWEFGQYNDRYGVQTFNQTTLARTYKRAIFDFVDFMIAHGAT
jgi:beta-glucosidase/6-phospho-beta-glucosidase/beta-galactosidase